MIASDPKFLPMPMLATNDNFAIEQSLYRRRRCCRRRCCRRRRCRRQRVSVESDEAAFEAAMAAT